MESLKERIPEFLRYIAENAPYLENNFVLLDIYEGNLRPYVEKDLSSALSDEYYKFVKDRIVPVNILKRLVDKLSRAYSKEPIRKASSPDDQKLVDHYVKEMGLNSKMNDADEYSQLFKGYSAEPFLEDGDKLNLRVLPFDRFLPLGKDPVNPLKTTVFLKSIGRRVVQVADRRSSTGVREEEKDIWFAYSDDEFIAFDVSGDIYAPAMKDNEDGENPLEMIPAMYANRGKNSLLPKQDTDILPLTKIFPVHLSDLSGVILFQCFSIMYGINIDSENFTMSPNAFWSFKSDSTNEGKSAEIGVITPKADIDKVMKYIVDLLALWLETRGIKVGAIGSVQGGDASNGISKIIDEMDTTEAIKKSIAFFKVEEKRIWSLIAKSHNFYVSQGDIKKMRPFSESFELEVEFDEPKPVIDREKEVRTIKAEVDAGFLDPESAIKKLYPNLSDKDLKIRLDFYNGVEAAESNNQDKLEV